MTIERIENIGHVHPDAKFYNLYLYLNNEGMGGTLAIQAARSKKEATELAIAEYRKRDGLPPQTHVFSKILNECESGNEAVSFHNRMMDQMNKRFEEETNGNA